MIRVQSSPAFLSAVSSTAPITLTDAQEEELAIVRCEISSPRGLVIKLELLPYEIQIHAEEMMNCSRNNQIIPFFIAAAKLQALLPEVFENHYLMIFNYLERSIQTQEDMSDCLQNLELIRSLIQPSCHANEIREIIAKKKLFLTRDIRSTKEILRDCTEENLFIFWNDQIVFLYQSCDAKEMQRELMGISVELDLSIHLKLGNISEVAKILGEEGIGFDLPACASVLAKLVEEPQILKQILDLIPLERREFVILKLIDRFSPESKNYTGLMFALAEASDDSSTKSQCSYKVLQLAFERINQASERRDEDAAFDIIKTAIDEETAFAMMRHCLLNHLPSAAARAVKLINNPNLRGQILINLGTYYFREAGVEFSIENDTP